jgi:hypothetical protein
LPCTGALHYFILSTVYYLLHHESFWLRQVSLMLENNMKTKLVLFILLAVALLVSSVSAGNGINLNGKHFTLNIIGSERVKGMQPDLSGHAIFVKLTNSGMIQTKIMLTEGDFAVLDKDGSDGTARFQLPYPLTPTGEGCYQVWARAQSPKGSANMYACEWDTTLNEQVCYYPTNDIITLERTGKGVGKFQDITKQLTFTSATTPIFGEVNHDYYWYYDNTGLKHAQLRFYQTAECGRPA